MSCERCQILTRSRKRVVKGYGDGSNGIMIVGEAPSQTGANITGIPFTGSSGQFFFSILDSLGILKRECYVTNAVKCSPPRNRKPSPDEIEYCSDYLAAELLKFTPSLVLTLGVVAGKAVLRKKKCGYGVNYFIGKTQVHTLAHPSFILHSSKRRIDMYEAQITEVIQKWQKSKKR